MRATATDPIGEKPVDLQRVDQRGHVGRDVRDSPAVVPGRAAVPRAVETDEPQTALPSVLSPDPVEQAGRRRPVVVEHQPAGRVTGLVGAKGAPVGQRGVEVADVGERSGHLPTVDAHPAVALPPKRSAGLSQHTARSQDSPSSSRANDAS